MSERSCPHCGKPIFKMRSSPDHRRFFGLIAKAFDQWPEAHEFAPESAEHLRAWLLCKAGFRESTPVMLPANADEHMRTLFRLGIEAAVRAAGGYAWVVPYRYHGAAVIRPRSIAWHKLGQREFAEVRSRVEDIIAVQIGVSADELLRQETA